MTHNVPPPPHIPVRPDWLAQHTEKALEPALAIIDPHHHLWQFPDKSYRTADLLTDLASGHDVRATVFIECGTCYRTGGSPEMAPLGEIDFVLKEIDAADKAGSPTRVAAAIVGYADLLLGSRVTPVLEGLVSSSGNRVSSIRNIGVWHADPTVRASVAVPPPHLFMDARFREGFSRLAPLGLGFDAWVIHTQLDELCSLAGAFPDTRLVLNHVGGPLGIGPYRGKRDDVFLRWRANVQALACYPNVHMKIGGFGMSLFGFDFYKQPRPPSSSEVANVIRPYVETCVEAFGAQRCMFESNFPVDKGNVAYGVLWNAFKRVVAEASSTEKAHLFHDTAAGFYQIDAA